MPKIRFTETLQAHVTPSRCRELKEWAADEKLSVSSLLRRIIAEHLMAQGWKPTPEEHRAIFGRKILRTVTPGGVYLIKCGDVFKIGRTRKLASRLAQMSLPHKPRIVYWRWCNDPGFVELTLHAMFPRKRLNGEWFDLDADEIMRAKEFMGSN